MPEYIYIYKKDIPIEPKTPLDYGYPLKVRKDRELIAKTFGGSLTKFITKDGKTGLFPNETDYVFDGDLNYFYLKLPVSLKPDAEQIVKNFIDKLKQNVSIRMGCEINKFDREQYNRYMLNTSNKFDPIKKCIKVAMREVSKEFQKDGHDLENDPRISNCQMFNPKQYEFINTISQKCKLYLDKEKDRYKIEVLPYQNTTQLGKKKREYFQALIKEKLNEIFPKKQHLKWILKEGGKLDKENFVMKYNMKDIYQSKVELKRDYRKVENLNMTTVLNKFPKLKDFICNVSKKTAFNTFIIINGKEEPIKFLDVTSTLKINGMMTFANYQDGEKKYKYENKCLYVNNKLVGKFKCIKEGNIKNGTGITMFIRKIV